MEPLLVADDLDGDENTGLVVDAADHLPEASFSKHINDLVPVRKMIAGHNGVVSALVVVAKVGTVGLRVANNLGGVLGATKVDVLIVHNLAPLVDVEHGNPNGFLGADTLLGTSTLAQGIQCPGRQFGVLATQPKLLHLLLSDQVVVVQVSGPNIVVPEGGR